MAITLSCGTAAGPLAKAPAETHITLPTGQFA